ncbi:MAG TPA: PTS sugar transporter subunit IIC [Lachnospiraceae bacterium]|nr:PTS sugar transporter subunit IIC [Lachnospiraceae bacterium]
MKIIKKFLKEIFIDGLGGMALGLFATLIIGTIISQVGTFVPGKMGTYLFLMGKLASALTGAGIGMGVAVKLKASPLVTISAASAGMIGAFASKIMLDSVLVSGVLATTVGSEFTLNNSVLFIGPGEPLGAFLAALACVYAGRLVSGKTKIDILITPFLCICAGTAVGLFVGPPISKFMIQLGDIIIWGTEQAPFLMGIVVAVLMGIILTLPISSAALGIILGLSGIAAGAATIGCCCNMIGFAVASYRDNKINGFLAQGLGTSMLQVGNIVKKPIIWLPAIISSAILGPISTMGIKMTNNAIGSGMGTSGLVGQINTYQDMVTNGGNATEVLIKIIVMHFLLPAILTLGISEFMRKKKWILKGDMKLEV